MRDYLLDDPALDEHEPPICDECGEFMETTTDGEYSENGRVVFSGSSTSCTNADCPSNQPNL